MNKLLLIDGYSLMHRAFYALPPLTNKDGIYTNAVFGFFNMLIKVVKEAKPDYLCVALDVHAPTFRHEEFAEYKGTRKPMPEELIPQLPLLRQTLQEIGVAQAELAGYEADDVIGTLSRLAELAGIETVIVTGDRDSLQLVSQSTNVWLTKKGMSETQKVTPQVLKDEYQLTPSQVIDLKGLMGDASDNIPGIPGVGEKTALKLIAEYQTLEGVLLHADEIKGKLGEKIRENKEIARLSYRLATIERNVPIQGDIAAMRTPSFDGAREPFLRLGFQSLLERLLDAGVAPATQDAKKTGWKEPKSLQGIEELREFLNREPCEIALFEADASLRIAFLGGDGAVIPLQGDLLSPGLDEETIYEALAPFLSGNSRKRVFDSKALRTRLAAINISLSGEVFDASLASYLIKPGLGQSPDKLLAGYGLKSAPGDFFDLCDELSKELQRLEMKELYDDIELPLSLVLFQMEQEGFKVDREALRGLQGEFESQIADYQQKIYKSVGESFNINSSQQLATILFDSDKLGLPSARKTSRGFSTDAEVLEGLQEMHPVVPLILQYRSIAKLKSTYVDSLLKLSGEDGLIHTTLNQTVTVTGRISSAEPNLQNIPVRTELGRVLRKVFVPRREGNVLVDADYSQIELRVLAHMAGEENMIRAFENGADIHASTAAQVYGVELGDVTPSMRSSAKAVNFGIVYGISDFGLAKNIGVSRKEAAEFIERYFARYPAVRTFMDGCVADARREGYVQTLFGRRRQIPEIASSNYNTRSFGERAAMNTPIQGTAADIIKIAMVRVQRALEAGGFRAKLILQVHDELIVDAPACEGAEVERLLKTQMEGAVSLRVPIVADVKIGKSWYETK